MRGMYYKNKLIDINDNSALKSMYDTHIITFNEDATFVYLRTSANDRGQFEFKGVDDAGNLPFYLKTTENFSYTMVNGSLAEKEYDGEKREYLVALLQGDNNTIIVEEYDSLMGTPKTDA